MQEKKRKRWYQRWWVWGIIAFLAIGIFSPTEEETTEETKEKESEEVKIEETEEETQEKEKKNNEDNGKKEEKEEEAKTSESATSEHVDNDQSNNENIEETQEISEQMALEIIKESFAGIAEVSFDKANKLYKIAPTDPAFEQELAMLIEGILGQEEWDTLVDSFVFMSDSAKGLIGNGYSIALLNPSNSDRYLLMVTDGEVEYDAFNE